MISFLLFAVGVAIGAALVIFVLFFGGCPINFK